MELEAYGAMLDRERAGSSPHCDGSIIFEVSRQPVSGLSFDFLVGNAPPNAIGALAFGGYSPACVPTLGANACLVPFATILLTSDQYGNASLPFAYAGQTGFRVQTAWFNTVICAGSQPLSSSATLDF